MIDFGDFYRLIAKSPLSHWLETLPSQLASWQKESLHGQFKQWINAVEYMPQVSPERLDLLHSVTAQAASGALSEGQIQGITTHLRALMPGARGRFTSTAFISIQNGVQTGNGSELRLTFPHW